MYEKSSVFLLLLRLAALVLKQEGASQCGGKLLGGSSIAGRSFKARVQCLLAERVDFIINSNVMLVQMGPTTITTRFQIRLDQRKIAIKNVKTNNLSHRPVFETPTWRFHEFCNPMP